MFNLLKSISKTIGSSILVIIIGILNTKIIALTLGTTGVGLYSLVKQLMQSASTIGAMGGQTPLVQGIASKDGSAKKLYIITTFVLFCISSSILVIVMFFTASYIAELVFDNGAQDTIILVQWMILPIVLSISLIYFSSIINGFHSIGRLAILQVLSPAVTLLMIFYVVNLVKHGYVLAFVWMFSIALLVSNIIAIWMIYRQGWLTDIISDFTFRLDPDSLKHFYKMASTVLFIGFISAIVLLAMRSTIVQGWSLHEAGIFDVAWTLSMAYGMVLINSLISFYMPVLSRVQNVPERNELMMQMLKIVVFMMVPLITILVVLKPLIISLLYSPEFIGALAIIQWALISDYFRATRLTLYMPVIAYADTRAYLVIELIYYAGLFASVWAGVFIWHSIAVIGIGFLLINLLLLMATLVYIQVKYQFVFSGNIVYLWSEGLLIIIAASIFSWGGTVLNPLIIFIFIFAGIIFPFIGITKQDKTKIKTFIYRLGNKLNGSK